MATLTLDRVWINRLDTGEAFSGYSIPNKTLSLRMDGQVRSYAGGRRRSMSTGGVGGVWPVAFRLQTLTTLVTLEDWFGVPVQVRDNRGQLRNGVYFELSITELHEPLYYDIGLDLQLVTVSEGV